MQPPHQIGIIAPVSAREAYLEPYRPWIESVTGCPRSETLTLECDFPFGQLAALQLLAGVELDCQCLGAAERLHPMITRWELPPGCSPRLEMIPSRNREAPVTRRPLAWDPHWKETPMALWVKGARHGIVSVNIPCRTSLDHGGVSWQQWTIMNRSEAAHCLNLLRQVEPERHITVIGGRDIRLPEKGYDWDSVVLSPALTELVRKDFEAFWKSETWFAQRRLPYKRGFLLHGPPGCGKTSVARVMACHPLVSAFSIDMGDEDLPGEALYGLFAAAEDRAPSVVILEDLDRTFATEPQLRRPGRITFQQLLSCLDGLATQHGIVVVATVNDASKLDAGILRRPGRFDRVMAFPLPSLELRTDYLRRLSGGELDEDTILHAARQSDRLSFAQLREAYVLTGQRAFCDGGTIEPAHLISAIQTVRSEANPAPNRLDGRAPGFESKYAPPISA